MEWPKGEPIPDSAVEHVVCILDHFQDKVVALGPSLHSGRIHDGGAQQLDQSLQQGSLHLLVVLRGDATTDVVLDVHLDHLDHHLGIVDVVHDHGHRVDHVERVGSHVLVLAHLLPGGALVEVEVRLQLGIQLEKSSKQRRVNLRSLANVKVEFLSIQFNLSAYFLNNEMEACSACSLRMSQVLTIKSLSA